MPRTFFSFVFSVPSSFCAFLACRFSVFAVNCRRGGQDCVLVLRVHMDTDLELEESLWRLSVRRLWSRRMCSLSRLLIVVREGSRRRGRRSLRVQGAIRAAGAITPEMAI